MNMESNAAIMKLGMQYCNLLGAAHYQKILTQNCSYGTGWGWGTRGGNAPHFFVDMPRLLYPHFTTFVGKKSTTQMMYCSVSRGKHHGAHTFTNSCSLQLTSVRGSSVDRDRCFCISTVLCMCMIIGCIDTPRA